MVAPEQAPTTGWRRFALPLVSAGLAALMLAPLLGRGFVLSYDMVFAPRQSLVPDALGLGTALPRSVPADAVVALTTAVVPGDIVQKAALVLAVFCAAYGAGRLVPTGSLGTRLVAATTYAWSAYFAERLFIGHWPLLLAYASLPWVAAAALGLRHGERGALARLVIASAPAALTPPGGVLAGVLACVLAGPRKAITPLLVSIVVNAPWWLPAVLHPGGTLSDPAGVSAFSARAESWGPAVLSVLGLGGIWNGDVVPASRGGPLAPVLILVTVALALFGLRSLAARWGAAPARSLVLLGAAGVLLAALATLPLGDRLLGAAMAHVPGAGLLRDAQKWVAWWALPLALGFALAVELLARRLRDRRGRAGLLAAAAAFPLLVLPDLAVGGWGRLEPVRYPDDWQRVHAVLAGADRGGDVLAMPLSAFRSFGWNGHRTQLDPAPRALPNPTVTDDALRVGGTVVAGEDPRLDQVRAARSARELAAAGFGWLLVEHGTPGAVDPRLLDGAAPVWTGPWLSLYRTPGELTPSPGGGPPRAPVVAAGLAAAGTVALAVLWCGLPMGRLTRRRSVRRTKE